MPAKDLGSKHTCFKCGTKFYDMKKPVALCPKCGADQRQGPASKPSSEKRRAAPKPPPKPAVEAEPEAELDEDLEADDDADEPDDDDEK